MNSFISSPVYGWAHQQQRTFLNISIESRRGCVYRASVYRHSFLLAFLLLFVISLALHVFFGAKDYNDDRAYTGQPAISIGEILLSAKFWSSTPETWPAEYLAFMLYVVLSIFLREQGSSKSKPIGSKDQTTGEVNE
jgi:hypothetical protein